ncbi:hypothetical protein PGB90_005652 [Kerria lacca]
MGKIGFAIAKKLASEGASVVVSSRKEQNVENAVNNLKKLGFENVLGTVCHVSKKEDRSKLFNKAIEVFGHIDILISNAAVNPVFGLTEECTDTAWDKIFEVNVKCPFMLTKEVLPYIRKSDRGTIIYISSIAGLQPFSFLGPYSISKTALLGLTKVFAGELATNNITVNCVAPGIIKTRFSKSLYESEVAYETILSRIPLNRIGEPDDVSGVVAFLCSADARYITGETIVVSGGMQSRL